MKNRILIIDGLNEFLKHYCINPTISSNGILVGALIGFVKSLQKYVREMDPSKVVICWESGGSKRKRQTNKNYKEGRKPVKLNRFVQDQLSPGEESENKLWQMVRLTEYLDDLPVYQLLYENVEGDDLIAFIARLERFSSWQKIIVSSDRDFIQLLDDKTILYRPVQKMTYNTKRVLEEFNIHPNNFCLARALAGDKSDNLKGIEGVGLKTVAKRFPFLAEEKSYYISDIEEYSKKQLLHETKPKVYNCVISEIGKIKENYSIMQLFAPSISIQDKDHIKNLLSNKRDFKQASFQSKMMRDEIDIDFSFEQLYTWCRRIMRDEKCDRI